MELHVLELKVYGYKTTPLKNWCCHFKKNKDVSDVRIFVG